MWLGVTYTPVCAFGELRLIVGTPLGDARPTGPINIVIGVPVALELSAPAFLGGVIGIVQPAVRTHQILYAYTQEDKRDDTQFWQDVGRVVQRLGKVFDAAPD